MRKKLDENDPELKLTSLFRKGFKIADHDLGILEISRHGEIEITAEDYEQMKKFGYIHVRTNVYPCMINFLERHMNAQDEDDVADFLETSITFRDHQAPSLENGGKRHKKVPKKTKPQQTEIAAGASDSVCSGCTVDPRPSRGDDLNQ